MPKPKEENDNNSNPKSRLVVTVDGEVDLADWWRRKRRKIFSLIGSGLVAEVIRQLL